MALNISVPEDSGVQDLSPKITVIGVGGAGGNAVNNMIEEGLEGVDFVVANTDAQSLAQSRAEKRIQLGTETTRGLGAGSKPEIGGASATESLEDITNYLKGSNMVFVAAGMGGGTGTGAAPVIACAARELGILTVGVVTKPFQFEGTNRMRVAEEGIEDLAKYVDTLIVIPNQNLFLIANEKTTFTDAFKMADDVLSSGVRSITDLIVKTGLINLDFADIETVMARMGKAMMGTGDAEGENRAMEAAERAISNPLLEDASIKGAQRVLINITGGMDMTLYELDEATARIAKEVDENAQIIVGSAFDNELDGKLRISVVATGINGSQGEQMTPRILDVRTAAVSRPEPEAAPASTPVTETKEEVIAPAANTFFETKMPEVAKVEPEVAPELAIEPAPEKPAPIAAEPKPFIPPKPTIVTPVERASEGINPFAAAEIENAPTQSAAPAEESKPVFEKRGPSLFERVTGVGRLNRDTEAADKPRPSVITGGADPAPVRTEKAKIAGITPGELPITSRSDDELLDIPAFLRRQAN